MASVLIPNDGSAQECSTSSAVTKIRVSVPVGTTIRLSTSSRRNEPGSRSLVGSIYESNPMLSKSEYS